MYPDFLVFSENIFVTLIVDSCKDSHIIAVMEADKQDFLTEVRSTLDALSSRLEALESKVGDMEKAASARYGTYSFESTSHPSEPLDLSLDEVEFAPMETRPAQESGQAAVREPDNEPASPAAEPSQAKAEEVADDDLPLGEEEAALSANQDKGTSVPEAAPVAVSVPKKAAMAAMSGKYAWNVDAPGSHVSNIISAISLNDRVLFINTLFGQDPLLFQSNIAKFNSMGSLEEALDYIVETFPKWNLSSPVLYKFIMAVRRKLQ